MQSCASAGFGRRHFFGFGQPFAGFSLASAVFIASCQLPVILSVSAAEPASLHPARSCVIAILPQKIHAHPRHAHQNSTTRQRAPTASRPADERAARTTTSATRSTGPAEIPKKILGNQTRHHTRQEPSRPFYQRKIARSDGRSVSPLSPGLCQRRAVFIARMGIGAGRAGSRRVAPARSAAAAQRSRGLEAAPVQLLEGSCAKPESVFPG